MRSIFAAFVAQRFPAAFAGGDALAQFFDPIDGGVDFVFVGGADLCEPSNGLAVFGDDDIFASRHPFEEGGKLGFCFVCADFDHFS